MSSVDVVVDCPVFDSFRVQQIAGMFDVPISSRSTASFQGELPDDDDWQIGAIVGPSGSGKTQIARKAFSDDLFSSEEFSEQKAVVDCFGDHAIKQITHLLTAVGFSSPPAWVKPYAVLSNGEQFRCQLVRALISDRELIVFDEFTSVVDRNVAKICSAALAKAIRKGLVKKRFVAVTCHYDVLEWLEVDWCLDMASGELTRRRLRRPSIEVFTKKSSREVWGLFKRHHYLNSNLGPATAIFVGFVTSSPVCFCSVAPFFGKTRGRYRKIRRITRLVVLPDYQGIGIGSAFLDEVARLTSVNEMSAVRIRTGHPGFIRHLQRSDRWKIDIVNTIGSCDGGGSTPVKRSIGRSVISAEFVGDAA